MPCPRHLIISPHFPLTAIQEKGHQQHETLACSLYSTGDLQPPDPWTQTAPDGGDMHGHALATLRMSASAHEARGHRQTASANLWVSHLISSQGWSSWASSHCQNRKDVISCYYSTAWEQFKKSFLLDHGGCLRHSDISCSSSPHPGSKILVPQYPTTFLLPGSVTDESQHYNLCK